MTRLRIQCRAPAQSSPFGCIVAGLPETEVYVVADDGSEILMTNVECIEWSVGATGEPARAVVTFTQTEMDVEGVAP